MALTINSKPAPRALFQHFHDGSNCSVHRFTIHRWMLRHDDIAGHNEFIFPSEFFQDTEKNIFASCGVQKLSSVITAPRDEVGSEIGKSGTDGTFSDFSDMFFLPWLVWPESLLSTFRI